MKIPSQRQAFLQGEGDAWFRRKRQLDAHQVAHLCDQDPLRELLENLPLPHGSQVSVLEVGCGQGLRLNRLKKTKGWDVCGLDPSEKAITAVNASECRGIVATAESLPMADKSVDLLIFGFCLYLCDRDDLFQIADGAHRVLKPKAWLAILDFLTPSQTINPYHHHLRHHATRSYTDEK